MLAASAAVINIDARLLDYSSSESTGEAELTLIQDWRHPGPESAILRIKIRSADGAAHLETTGDILASLRGQINHKDEYFKEPEPGTCSPCEAARKALDTGERINNARAIANLRELTSAFITAFDQQIQGACQPPAVPDP
jgi:hypothetical protein